LHSCHELRDLSLLRLNQLLGGEAFFLKRRIPAKVGIRVRKLSFVTFLIGGVLVDKRLVRA